MGDLKFAVKLDKAAYELRYYAMVVLARTDSVFVVESDFEPEHGTPRLLTLQQQTGLAFVQLNCRAQHKVLDERFIKRTRSGNRHPGHHDAEKLDEYRRMLQKCGDQALDLGGPIITLDTTSESAAQDLSVIATVRNTLKHLQAG